jgi:hypothetical protein
MSSTGVNMNDDFNDSSLNPKGWMLQPGIQGTVAETQHLETTATGPVGTDPATFSVARNLESCAAAPTVLSVPAIIEAP